MLPATPHESHALPWAREWVQRHWAGAWRGLLSCPPPWAPKEELKPAHKTGSNPNASKREHGRRDWGTVPQ